jgi:serine protease inhibitor
MMLCTKPSWLHTATSLTLLATACAPGDDPVDPAPQQDEGDGFEVVYSRQGLTPGAAIDMDAVERLRVANTSSALVFYTKLRELDEDEEGFVFSPFSLSRAVSNYYVPDHRMSLAFEGLFGFTEQTASEEWWQMTSHLAMTRDDVDPDRHSSFLSSDIYWVDDQSGGNVEGQFDLVHALPIAKDPKKAVGIINAWIEKRSGGLLVDFLSEDALGGGVGAVTTNVLFFKGPWRGDFESGSDLTFASPSGSKAVPTFKSSDTTSVDTHVEEGLTVVSMPFSDDYRFVVLMPDDLDAFDTTLDQARFDALLNALQDEGFGVIMPTIKLEYEPPIGDTLREISDANGYGYQRQGANFSGAHVEDFNQKAVLEVDETGAKAAAATVVIESDNNAPGPPERLVIDKPFVYLIQDGVSGNVLFMGLFTGE